MSLQCPQGVVDQDKAQQSRLDAVPQLLLLKLEDGEIKERLLLTLEVDVLQGGAVFPLHATLHHLVNEIKEKFLCVCV